MELRRAIEDRRSVRAFTTDPVDEATVRELGRLAGMAPSSHNAQPWHFHVATGGARVKVGEILSQTTAFVEEYLESLDPEQAEMAELFFAELGRAPTAIAVSCVSCEDEVDRIISYLGVGGAVQNFQLAAHERGLGTCNLTFSFWVRDELAEVFEVPEGRRILCVLLLGVPALDATAPPRREEVVSFVE